MRKNYFEYKFVDKKNIIEYNKINKFILNNYPFNKERTYQIGFETFGILLVGICNWLHNQKKINKNNELIFLARDGYIIEKAYNILFPIEDTKYMYVSRRSLSLPSIYLANNINDIFECMVLPPIFNIKSFLNNINLNIEDYQDVLKKFEINEHEVFKRSEFKNNQKLIRFVEHIEKDIRNKAQEQHNLFKKYLNQINFKKNVGIVDIGWHNSIQLNLMKLINSDLKIDGYYVGVYNDAKKIKKPCSSSGFLYTYGDNLKRQYKTFSFVSLFESMFLSQEGTTIRYGVDNGNIIPIKLQYEYKENKELENIIKNFQDGALELVKLYKKKSENSFELTPDLCSANLISFGCNPKKEDLRIFEKLSFENYEINNIVNYKKIHYII